MILQILLLIAGLALILCGANALTDGASAVAKRWGVSDLVIGLTVVAFGTSAPELTISIVSACKGNAGLAVGNVVGSNIFNILAIIGIVALFRPIRVTRALLANDIPLVLISSLALLAIGSAPMLGNSGSAVASRSDGILLLLFFIIFLRYTFASARNENALSGDADEIADEGASVKTFPVWKSVLWIAFGLAALIFGGDMFVNSASGIASALGVSDAVIGLTIVAAGTSLPELATSLAAALKGKTGIALGNVIGSCIFNAFMVLGVSAVISPLPFGQIGPADLITLSVASLLFWIFGRFFRDKTITRIEGALLTLIYISYIAYQVIRA